MKTMTTIVSYMNLIKHCCISKYSAIYYCVSSERLTEYCDGGGSYARWKSVDCRFTVDDRSVVVDVDDESTLTDELDG